MIPRPRGVAGKDYCIQIEMGLATSERNDQKYSALMVRYLAYNNVHRILLTIFDTNRQRGLRDLVIRSQINWELPWADIPASEKAKLFSVVSFFNFFDTGVSKISYRLGSDTLFLQDMSMTGLQLT